MSGVRRSERQVTCAQGEPLVEYKPLMAIKRRVLEMLSRQLFAGASQRREAVEEFWRDRPARRGLRPLPRGG